MKNFSIYAKQTSSNFDSGYKLRKCLTPQPESEP